MTIEPELPIYFSFKDFHIVIFNTDQNNYSFCSFLASVENIVWKDLPCEAVVNDATQVENDCLEIRVVEFTLAVFVEQF